MPLQKQFLAKVFASDGTTFRKNFTTGHNGTLKNLPTFQSRLNGGYGECVLDLNLPFDDFDEGVSIEFMNIVRIFAVSVVDGVQSEDLIYTGFISRYEPYIELGGEQGVRVTLLGLVSLLSFSYYEDGDLSVSHSTDDPEDIGRAIIDNVNTKYAFFSYSNATTDSVGTGVSIDFEDQKWIDALKKTAELAGGDWWWKIDESGQYWLKAKPGTATHTFTIGRDVDSIVAPKDSEKVVNDVIVRWDAGTVTDDDATSQSRFGIRTKIISESNLTDAPAASQRAAKEVNDNKDEKIAATIVINSKYDLESIKVGHTCRLANYDMTSTFFNDNMMISSVQYLGESVRVEVEEEIANFGLELNEFVNG